VMSGCQEVLAAIGLTAIIRPVVLSQDSFIAAVRVHDTDLRFRIGFRSWISQLDEDHLLSIGGPAWSRLEYRTVRDLPNVASIDIHHIDLSIGSSECYFLAIAPKGWRSPFGQQFMR